MVDKGSLSIGIIALLISAGGIAYTASSLGTVSSDINKAKNDLSAQITTKTSPIESSVGTVRQDQSALKQEQAAIRTLVEQKVGGLEQALKEAQSRLAEAEKKAAEQAKELEQLRASAALEEQAKKEQAPLIYGVIDAPDFANIVWPRFREAYPWAPTSGRYIEGFGPLRARFASEFQAGAPTADIVWQPEGNMLIELAPKGFFAPFPEMRYRGLYTEATVHEGGILYGTHLLLGVIVYNTNLVSANDAPKGWSDLANPNWKNKIALQNPTRLGTPAKSLADLFPILGQEKWETLAKGLAANNPLYTGSDTEAYIKVLAGEAPIGVVLINDVLRQKPGTPVAVAWPQEEPIGVPIGSITQIAVNVKAANPNFARLFVEWLLGPLGQKALGETGRSPVLTTVDVPVSLGKVLPPGMKILPSNRDFYQNGQQWADRYKALFGG